MEPFRKCIFYTYIISMCINKAIMLYNYQGWQPVLPSAGETVFFKMKNSASKTFFPKLIMYDIY